MAKATHTTITNMHSEIARAHKGLKGFYRFNMSELDNNFRSGVQTPVLLLESYSSYYTRNPNKTANFKNRDISFLLLDFTGSADNYDKQEEVLSALDEIADDICSLLDKYRKDKNHWMYGMFDSATYKVEKVGPLWDNMYGWNVMYSLDNHQPLCFEDSKWDFTVPGPTE